VIEPPGRPPPNGASRKTRKEPGAWFQPRGARQGRFINRLEIELTWFVESPPAPLFQRGERFPPFGKGRLGGIFRECPDNYEALNKPDRQGQTGEKNAGIHFLADRLSGEEPDGK
jgi:hypothetical protein